MRICVAQTKPVKGDVQGNIDQHKKLIDLAVAHRAETIIFPELSLTGYEPELAGELATTVDDHRLNDFQIISDDKQITVGVGMPIRGNGGIFISLIIFQPGQLRQIYSKQYLHEDEYPYFINGQQQVFLSGKKKIALAICYEVSVPEHAEHAFKNGAEIYLASVAKTQQGVEKATASLSHIARSYSVPVLMSNCVGPSDNFISAGASSVWNAHGVLVAQLNTTDEGILVFDTETEEVIEARL